MKQLYPYKIKLTQSRFSHLMAICITVSSHLMTFSKVRFSNLMSHKIKLTHGVTWSHPVSFLLFALSLFSLNAFSQVAGGTITFKISGGEVLAIDAVATDLFDGGVNVYNLSGNTNQAISFSNWSLNGALDIGDFQLDTYGYAVLGNPASELNAIVSADNSKDISVRIVDVNGRIVSKPFVTLLGNGKVKLYDPLTNCSAGVYFVQIKGVTNASFKFIKNNAVVTGLTKKSTSKINAQIRANENYKISWSGNGIVSGEQNVEIVEGSTNSISMDVNLVSNESGDVRINTDLKGSAERGTIITLTNTQTPDSTYTINSGDDYFADFMNVFVENNHNPTQYKIEVIDSDADGRFLKTTTLEDIYQDDNFAVNGSKVINLDEIPNTQNLSAIIRNYKTLNEESGVTVELHNSNTNALINSQTSDATGHVEFTDVPGSTDVYTVVKKAGYYTKTNGKHNIDLVDHISEMNDTINVTAVEHMNNKEGNFISGEIIQKFKPIAYNTEFLLGHLRMYFPPTDGRQTMIDQFTEAATLLEMPGAIIPSDTNFTEPTSGQIGGYNPYPESREVYDGLIGTNITNYSGTSTSATGKFLPNGIEIYFYAKQFNLGGLDKSANHHELGNLLGFPLVNGNTTDFKTSRDTNAAESFEFQEATYDIPVMSTWLKLGKHHFNTTDNQGRMMEYNTTTKFE